MTNSYNKQSSFQEKLKRAFLFLKGETTLSTLVTAFRVFQKMLFGWNLYTTLYEFPLHKYIDFSVTSDKRFSRRFKRLYVPNSLHIENEKRITEEYIKISENATLKHNKGLSEKINDEIVKIRTFQIVLGYIKALVTLEDIGRTVNDETWTEFCKKNRIRIKPFTKERAILVLDNEIKTAYITFESLKKQYKNTEKSDSKITREDFSKWIAILNYNKLGVDYNMSVADYIQRINMYQKMCEELKNYGK